MRFVPLYLSLAASVGFGLMALFVTPWLWVLCAAALAYWATAAASPALPAKSTPGFNTLPTTRHSLRRNYPILANLRFLLEKVRPEIRQYFLESDSDGTPYNRNKRAIVYQRAKGQLDKRPFGTQQDVYGESFEWLAHSLVPREPASSASGAHRSSRQRCSTTQPMCASGKARRSMATAGRACSTSPIAPRRTTRT